MKGRLEISALLRNDKTILEKVFFSAPFKLADISKRQDKVKKVMVMNASPGILNGDEYTISVKLGTGALLQMETQSYQRLFQMQQGAAQQMTVNLMPRSSFTYIPHPSVPHKGAIFSAVNKIYLSEGCRLLWGEIITPGRMLQNEQFGFTRYQSKTDIYLTDKLVVKDNLILCPGTINPLALGNLEGHTHQATLFFITPGGCDKQAFALAHELLEGQTGVTWGITRLQVAGFAIRLLGSKAEPLFKMLQQIAALVHASALHIKGHEH